MAPMGCCANRTVVSLMGPLIALSSIKTEMRAWRAMFKARCKAAGLVVPSLGPRRPWACTKRRTGPPSFLQCPFDLGDGSCQEKCAHARNPSVFFFLFSRHCFHSCCRGVFG